MIREYADHIPEDYRVSVPVVHPWTRYPECRACGHVLGAHIWGIRRLFWAKGNAAQSYAYCRGDHNSQEQVPTINIATGQFGTAPVNVPCFGIIEEHIHLGCGRCGFDWLMACKGKK